MFAGKKSAQIREILISESAWEEMTCLFAPSLMKRFPLFLLFTLLTLSTVPAQADIIDDTIGNIQQAINDAYNPDRGRDYEDSRDDGWQREVSDDRRRQYDDRRRQFEDRRRQLDDRQRQLDQERRQLEDEERRMEDEYGR